MQEYALFGGSEQGWINKIRLLVVASCAAIFVVCAFVFDQCLPAYPVASLLAVAFIKYMVIDLPLLALSSLRSSLLATFRTFLDLIIIGGLIFFTGGFFSPFILILIFELSIFILYYPKVNALIIAVGMFLVICGISLANTFSSASLIVPSLALSAGIFLVASLATSYGLSYLVSSILKKQEQIDHYSKETADLLIMMEKELRQPLDIINKYANAILSGETGPTTEDLNKYNTIISKQTSRILNLTSDLTNLAQFETSKTKIEKSKVNLSSVIDNVFDEMLAQAAPKNNKLIKEVDAQLPEVTANANNILQVIINLISNAIKFSPDNGLIKISAQKDGEGLIVVEVKDQGLGIEKKDLEKVFEKFYSVSSETARVKSTGLGLALCKTIIEAHGGRIWAESEGKGKGSSFKFTLPIN